MNTAMFPLRTARRRLLLRAKSTLALTDFCDQPFPKPTISTKNPIPDFRNARIAHGTKSTYELLRAAFCFRACMIKFLVQHAEGILQTSRRLLGDTIVDAALKTSLYGQFCAGEDQKGIQPTIQKLKSAGVGSILDYAAESDDNVVHSTPTSSKNAGHEYDYAFEEKCDQHLSTFLQCIRDVASTNGSHDVGFAAVKVTALGNPKLLARLSNIIKTKENVFEFDHNDQGRARFDDLTVEEINLLNALYDRGCRLAEEASKFGVRLLFDAEQVRYQPAIDNLVLELQRRFNHEYPIVYNTYQCYLRDSPERLHTDVMRSERIGYHFGGKLVRGAYMESERELAKTRNYEDPIHTNIADTHKCYNDAVDYLLEHSTRSKFNVEVMCATHNTESIVHAIERMNEYEIARSSLTISFAQLYGMSDSITFNLGKHGYRAYKYLPYGQVQEVIPYLLRRAQENSAIVGGASNELKMIDIELMRRVS